jgi:hypothetical protein
MEPTTYSEFVHLNRKKNAKGEAARLKKRKAQKQARKVNR